MRIGILGSGQVGETLANGFLNHGYEVMRGSRDPKKLEEWKSSVKGKAQTGSFAETAQFGEVLVLAVKGGVAEEVIRLSGIQNLKGKVIIDPTNPIADLPPVNGVLQFFTANNESLMERLQRAVPDGHWVKAFSCVGADLMVNPKVPGGPPTMFICGNQSQAKEAVTKILTQFGWEVEDMGTVEAARAIEPLSILWCLRGFTKDQWSHAFKLLKG